MAVRQLLMYLNEGYERIVDRDLEKFFDNMPQDRLMSLVLHPASNRTFSTIYFAICCVVVSQRCHLLYKMEKMTKG